jgi:hypothetical protein
VVKREEQNSAAHKLGHRSRSAEPPGPTLVLRRANVSRKSGEWKDEDYDVFDGDRDVGRIFLDANETWFWGLAFEFQLSGQKRYGSAATLDATKAAFRAEYDKWQREVADGDDR